MERAGNSQEGRMPSRLVGNQLTSHLRVSLGAEVLLGMEDDASDAYCLLGSAHPLFHRLFPRPIIREIE